MVREKCTDCGGYKYDWREHHCAPIYYFKHEDYGEEFQEIRAYSFDDAAENFAKQYNEDGDYSLMNNSIDVIISDGKTEKKYTVSAEPDIHYSVDEVES